MFPGVGAPTGRLGLVQQWEADLGQVDQLDVESVVPHGKVVNLMERAKGAGLTHLAIGTSGG